MTDTPRVRDSQSALRSPVTMANQDRHSSVTSKSHPVAKPYRRFHRGVGFWLGGILLGVGGCILGAGMPYSHPIAVTISVLWWGIYFGCFGASIGALLGMWAEQTPTAQSESQIVRAGTGAGWTTQPFQPASAIPSTEQTAPALAAAQLAPIPPRARPTL